LHELHFFISTRRCGWCRLVSRLPSARSRIRDARVGC
jgi:hypothetical protein